jgi:glutamate---cysteine ligase / carboxylate-amine ligase
MRRPPTFTLGIEEEYLVVDRATRDLVAEPDPRFLDACRAAVGDRVSAEFLQCQVEVGTRPHRRVSEAVAELAALRAALARAAGDCGYAMLAASTHPFSRWRDQSHSRKPRYEGIRSEIGQPADRLMICGMHVHVAVEDDDQRIDLMNQAAYFLPHLLALSTSSPFWEGRDTSLASYRLTIMDALPRSGLPDVLTSHADYRQLVDRLVEAGCIEDATKIWWDIRPSDRYPTLEQRVTDICPRLADVAAIAALYQSLLALLHGLGTRNQCWRLYPATLILENRWRAQRYGVAGELVDHGTRRQISVATAVDELIALTGAEAEALGCRDELLLLRSIASDGTSADRQRRVLREATAAGAEREEALIAVVDALLAEFLLPAPSFTTA